MVRQSGPVMPTCCLTHAQAVLAESEARRSRHLQELEGFRASREQVQAQLAAAEAQLSATQAALAQVCTALSVPPVCSIQCRMHAHREGVSNA